jgi:hypothetical protein
MSTPVPARTTYVSPFAKPAAYPLISWLTAALVLAIGAQLITISALNSADPLSSTWYSLLLATAPAPVAALPLLAASGRLIPPRYLPAMVAADLIVLLVAMISGITHTGLFFLPELIILVLGTARLWRSRPSGTIEG